MDAVPVDIDVHRIPDDSVKGEPEHWHADFRYAFRADGPEMKLQLDEVTHHGWRSAANLGTANLAAKISRLPT